MIYDDVLTNSAAFLNDASKSDYTNAVQLPYLNIALSELQEIFALNGIPVTQESSAVINVVSGQTAITSPPDTPVGGVDYLPSDLVEINRLYSSPEGQSNWSKVSRVEYLTEFDVGNVSVSHIGVWAWMDNEVRVLPPNQNNDIKLDYIKTLFPLIDSSNVDDTLTLVNSATFLGYRTAGLVAEFIGENPSRAQVLNGNASLALDRSLGISIKGKQSIIFRRRPFRAAFKRRGMSI